MSQMQHALESIIEDQNTEFTGIEHVNHRAKQHSGPDIDWVATSVIAYITDVIDIMTCNCSCL